MLEKLKSFLGLDELPEATTHKESESHELKLLKAENQKLKGLIDQKNVLLQELSKDNMAMGRDRQELANMVVDQQRQLDVYKSMLI